MGIHKSHPAIIKRLKRAQGHLRSIVRMLEDKCSCLDVAQQLQAVEKAVCNAKKTLIHDHIDHCLSHDDKGGANQLSELKKITKYL